MSREAWPIEYHRHASVTVDLVTIVLCCFASLYRPDGQKKAYVRLAPDYDALDVANKVGTNESLAGVGMNLSVKGLGLVEFQITKYDCSLFHRCVCM